MGFGNRKGWDKKVEGKVIGPPSNPDEVKTTSPSLDAYLDELPPAVAPEAEPPEEEAIDPPSKPVRYHSIKNKLSPGLHVLRIGGELTDDGLKRIIDFIEAELKAVHY